MDLFREARKAFGKAADGISRGAEAVRLETEIADVSRRVTEDWAAVGRRAQVLVRLGRVEDPELRSLIESAEKLEEKLQGLQRQAQAIRRGVRIRRCPGCGAAIMQLMENCDTCGAKLPVCRKCLEPLSAGDTTCPACGEAVPAPEGPGAGGQAE